MFVFPSSFRVYIFNPLNINQCRKTSARPGDGIDNDCDGKVDEETVDGQDNDGDGFIDEDMKLVIKCVKGPNGYRFWYFINRFLLSQCKKTKTKPGDALDNDCDGAFDEELLDGKDNDGDGRIDEDIALVKWYYEWLHSLHYWADTKMGIMLYEKLWKLSVYPSR